jgi:hypothetical protein
MGKEVPSDTVGQMNRRLLSLVLAGMSATGLAGCVARRTKAAMLSYDQVFKPGTTRKDVEEYLRVNKVPFGRMFGSSGYPLEDFIKIGTRHFPVPCGDESYYVAFLFDDQTEHPPVINSRADDLDTLRSITTFHWVDDCF